MEALLSHSKQELCEIILKYEIACNDIQEAVVELLNENENLKIEADSDSKAYDKLLIHKKNIK